ALYHYWIDAQFGWMNGRIPSWLPFPIQIVPHREQWLARMLAQHKIRYRRDDICFPRIENVAKAQRLMNRQLRLSWPKALARIVGQLNPAPGRMFRGFWE